MTVENLHSDSKKINTDLYFERFNRPDIQVVAEMAAYVISTEQNIKNIILRKLEGTQKDTAVIYVEENTPQGPVWTELNWADPGLPPSVYDRYAFDFYNFSGDYQVQHDRALLLAAVLKKPFTEIDAVPQNALRINGLGVIMLKNPLKSNPLARNIILNPGSHLRKK